MILLQVNFESQEEAYAIIDFATSLGLTLGFLFIFFFPSLPFHFSHQRFKNNKIIFKALLLEQLLPNIQTLELVY